MSIAFNIGRSIGSAAATVVYGTRIGGSQFAAGTKQGYASRAEELIAKRKALGLSAEPTTPVEVVPAPKGRRTARA